MDPISLIVGLIAGAALGALVVDSRHRGRLGVLEAQRAAGEEASQRERELFETGLAQMKETFEGLASKSLKSSNESFLGLASQSLKPLRDELAKLERETKEMEKTRSQAYGSLRTELQSLRESTQTLQEQSTALATALKGSSRTRGVIGEMILRNIIEMAGMTKHCDFLEQVQTPDGGRPDIVVNLPGKGQIPIDAKFPFAAYHEAMETEDPAARESLLQQHATDLTRHIDELRRRDYATALGGQIDFTVLFLPGEHLLSAAFEQKPELLERALADRILIATPVTLVALLRTVGLYWKQHDLAEGAREIQEQASELHKRIGIFVGHLANLGRNLGRAQDAYNDAVGSYEARVLPAGRQLEALNATTGELEKLEPNEKVVRTLKALPSPEE